MSHKFIGPIRTQAEDFLLDMGVQMFTITGPVFVNGVSASVVYGFIHWLLR